MVFDRKIRSWGNRSGVDPEEVTLFNLLEDLSEEERAIIDQGIRDDPEGYYRGLDDYRRLMEEFSPEQRGSVIRARRALENRDNMHAARENHLRKIAEGDFPTDEAYRREKRK